MARNSNNQTLKGIYGSAPISTFLGDSNMGGNISITNSNWSVAKAGPVGDSGMTAETLSVVTKVDGGNYTITRSFLQFELPTNISRFDQNPVLMFRSSSGTGRLAVTSVAYNYFQRVWTNWDANRLWDAVYTSTSAIYGTPSVSSTSVYTVAGLNMLASYHCMTQRFVTMAVLDFVNDFSDSTPSGNFTMAIDDFSDANPPYLVLRKPWFIDKGGDEYPLTEDLVIRASDPTVNQRDRRVAQLPFGSAIKGPANLRQRNAAYKVTKG